MDDLITWLESELKNRQWKPADLARAANVPDATISRILNGRTRAGVETCNALAEALNEPHERVFRLAGLLPPLPAGDDPALNEGIELLRSMSTTQRREAIKYLRFLLEQND
ncbi:MAG: helix-turn-helix transcriptional regulator [Anaerolineae bacterium]|nr:helix-turn-helix transcriptional regulator [Anaerolineae bacterium]